METQTRVAGEEMEKRGKTIDIFWRQSQQKWLVVWMWVRRQREKYR